VDDLLALVGFSFVSAATPGPNNVLLWASGAEFGFRRTLRHVVGTAIGIAIMALGAAAGLAALVTTIPQLGLALKIAGSLYLLYLAWQIAGAGAIQRSAVSRPLGLVQAALFQAVNPKGWVFVLGAMTTFRPDGWPVVTGSLLVTLTMFLVVIPSAALWAGAGGLLSRLVANEQHRRVVSLALGVIVALTVISVWV
jgi:threonine/homoserine/homoserine lactone efflux protein